MNYQYIRRLTLTLMTTDWKRYYSLLQNVRFSETFQKLYHWGQLAIMVQTQMFGCIWTIMERWHRYNWTFLDTIIWQAACMWTQNCQWWWNTLVKHSHYTLQSSRCYMVAQKEQSPSVACVWLQNKHGFSNVNWVQFLSDEKHIHHLL